MPKKDRTGLQRWGAVLAATRGAAKMTVRQLAEATHFSPATISNYEYGHRMPRKREIALIEDALGTNGRLQELFDDLVGSQVSPEWSEWQDIEAHANRILCCDHSVIPGLLQTEDYARAILGHDRYSPLDLEQRVERRMERQRILDGDNPPTTVFVVGEFALNSLVGSREVMYEQINQLIKRAQQENVIIYVVPEDAGYHDGLSGAFMIAKLDGKEVASQDAIWRGQILRDDAAITALGNYWQHILSKALSVEASLERLIEKAEEWK